MVLIIDGGGDGGRPSVPAHGVDVDRPSYSGKLAGAIFDILDDGDGDGTYGPRLAVILLVIPKSSRLGKGVSVLIRKNKHEIVVRTAVAQEGG